MFTKKTAEWKDKHILKALYFNLFFKSIFNNFKHDSELLWTGTTGHQNIQKGAARTLVSLQTVLLTQLIGACRFLT